MTDPDAPNNDHCIHLRLGQEPLWAFPVLFSKSAHFDPAKGGEFHEYVELRFLRVERRSGFPSAQATYDAAKPELPELGRLYGFYGQVGRNTNYIIRLLGRRGTNRRLLKSAGSQRSLTVAAQSGF